MTQPRGQATVEFALALAVVMIPLTFALIAFAEIAWTYHAMATLTRQGAHYAATHCWQDEAGSNVTDWMKANSPPFIDRPLLTTGAIQIEVNYWMHDAANHASQPFSCGGGCNPSCVPDSVTVKVSGYQFNHFLPMIGLRPLQVPAFATTVEMQSAGGDPETATSIP